MKMMTTMTMEVVARGGREMELMTSKEAVMPGGEEEEEDQDEM